MSNYRQALNDLYTLFCSEKDLNGFSINLTVKETSSHILDSKNIELPLTIQTSISNMFCFYNLLDSNPILLDNNLDILRTIAKIPLGSLNISSDINFNYFKYIRCIEIYLNIVLLSEAIPLNEKSVIVDFLKGKPLMKNLKEQLFNNQRTASLAEQLGINRDIETQETPAEASLQSSAAPLSEQLNINASDDAPRTRQLFGGQVTINI